MAVAAFACLVVSLALAPAAMAGWSEPVSLASESIEPDVVLTGGGGAVAVWEALGGHFIAIEGSIRVDGAWEFTSPLTVTGFEPSLAALGESEAIAVWDGIGVEAALATPRGWTSLPPIPHSVQALAPEVATDGTGQATVVWRQPGPGGATIDVATREAGRGWSAPRRLSRPGEAASAPQVAVAPSGAAVAVWRRGNGQESVIQAAVRSPSGGWSAPVDLSAKGERAVAPAVAIDPAGEAVAVWRRFDGGHQIIQTAAHRLRGRWSGPTDLSAPGRDAEAPDVAISPEGEAVAVWERFDGRIDRIQAATRAPGGRWSTARNISASPRSAHEPSLAIDAEGVARAVWMGSERHGAAVIEASHPAAGSWSAPVRIAHGAGQRREAAIDGGSAGEALAAWGGHDMAVALRSASP